MISWADRVRIAEFQVYEQQESQYLAKYGQPASGGGLAALGQLVGAVSDWVPMFEAMDAAAPPDIEPDAHNIVDSLKQQERAFAEAGRRRASWSHG